MLTAEQQRMIVAAVLAGASWPSAALAAGVCLDDLHDFIEAGRQGRCKLRFRFIARLKRAGEKATEASLKHHKRGTEHA